MTKSGGQKMEFFLLFVPALLYADVRTNGDLDVVVWKVARGVFDIPNFSAECQLEPRERKNYPIAF